MKSSIPDLKTISQKHNVSEKEVLEIYKKLFLFIRKKIANIQFTDINEEDFKKQKVNFNIPEIGKLATRFDRVEYINNLKYKKHE